jgi:Xaa-Pro aminopeptidase
VTVRDAERIERNMRALRDADLDAVLCALPSNVLLLSGYWPVVGTSIAVATRDGAVGLVTPTDEADLAGRGWADATERFTPGSLDRLTPLIEAVLPALQRIVRRLGLVGGQLGLERGPALEPSSYAGTNRYGTALRDALPECCPQAVPVPADDMLLALRGVLTPRELGDVRQACRVAEDAFRAGARSIVPGASEREVAAAFRAPLMAYADAEGAPPLRAGGFMFCMSGPNAAAADRAYARTRARRIAPGDPVMVHCNSFLNGFWTDITRTYLPAPGDDLAAPLFDAVLEARTAALGAIAPGVRASEVDRAAREVLARHGWGDCFPHGTGHGVGFAAIDHHARPRVHPASDDVLESGMVFNIEPAIYHEGWGGIRQCDLVAVGPHGVELLTPFQATLEALAPRLVAY